MLYPPLDKIKENVNSKYLVVTLAAKRARELEDNRFKLTGTIRFI